MKRISLGLAVLLCSFTLVVACNQPAPNGGGNGGNGGNGGTTTDGGATGGGTTDGGSTGGGTTDGGSTGGGTTDGGTTGGSDGGTTPLAGTVTVNSSGNALPNAWKPAITALASDGSGAGASAHQDVLVTLTTATTVNGSAACGLPYTSKSGKTYCDSFTVQDGSGNQVIVDDYSFLGAHPAGGCTMPPADGTSLASVTGTWEAHYDSSKKTTTWAIALIDCAGIGQGTGYSGSSQAPMSQDIANLKSAGLQDGPSGSVRGVVIATWSASTAWGFTMEDTDGGAAINVKYSSSSSTSTATEPAVGDDVTVTGTVVAVANEIKL